MNYKDILELKNTNMKLHEIKIYSSDIDEVSVELKKLKKKVKNIVVKNPIILNFEEIDVKDISFIENVYEDSINIGIKVIGVKNLKEKIRKKLNDETDIPVFMNSSESSYSKKGDFAVELKPEKPLDRGETTPFGSGVKVFNDVIRTGQKIEHVGDIFILSKVNSSAEIYSTGSVFVSAFVGGKIFAGVDLENKGQGDSNAVIYIENFNASLVCINGIFKNFENIDKNYQGKRVRIYLEEEIIKIDLVENI